jgi:hypothetical protein
MVWLLLAAFYALIFFKMPKRTFSIAFKKEVVEFMQDGNTAWAAAKHFGNRDKNQYDHSMFHQWYKKAEQIQGTSVSKKRISGGGRKPALGELETMLSDEILELRLMKLKVTRKFISDRAQSLAEEYGIELRATGHWITGFMKRQGFSLRRTTNLTTLTNDQLIQRAIEYMKYLQSRIASIDLSKTILMDETAVYFEDVRTQTVDIKGRKHVVMKSTGFASMRITAMIAVWADGRKAPPTIIQKGVQNVNIQRQSGPILYATQPKAWVNALLIIKWIDSIFPLIDTSPGKCIVWDSCRAHIAKDVKEHCRRRNIEMIVIPGGLTPYLQAGDIGIFREFKDKISIIIDEWKRSAHVQYTKGGNPKPPKDNIMRSWVLDSWRSVSESNIRNSIASAGFANDFTDWHISKHDVYGSEFVKAWMSSGDVETCLDDMEAIPQDDELDYE